MIRPGKLPLFLMRKEEHYPHSMANAVVAEAKQRGLTHEEYHSQVQYVVAHGISSMVEEKKVIIGSAHFVFEDEGCRIPAGEQEKYDGLPAAYSHLYLCIDGKLAAGICIHDPLRREARDTVKALHDCGFTNVVMMTGDNRRTAEAVAREVGVDAVYAEVLPEDKAAFVRREKAKATPLLCWATESTILRRCPRLMRASPFRPAQPSPGRLPISPLLQRISLR